MSAIWTHDLLNALRQIGDPTLDTPKGKDPAKVGWRTVEFVEADPANSGSEGVRLLQTWRKRPLGALPLNVRPADPYWSGDPVAADGSELALAQELFVLNGGEIAAALLMAALPATYAARIGAEVLAQTGELQSNARRRIAETAQLTVDVLFPLEKEIYPVDKVDEEVWASSSRSLKPGGHGYVRVRSTRLTHAVIRELVSTSTSPKWKPLERTPAPCNDQIRRGVPINQEDLLGVLGTFTIAVIDAVERLGVSWEPDAQQAYIDLWDRVGALLGIGGEDVTDQLVSDGATVPDGYHGRLRPRTVDEFRELVGLIIERTWTRPKPQIHMAPFDGYHGKVLVRALLDELQSAMPRGMERLPLMVMRYLVHPNAQELLGLGGGGLTDALAQLSRGRRRKPALMGPMWFGDMMVGTGMRMVANEVSRRAFVHFITTREFRFPTVSIEDVRLLKGRRSG